MADEVFISYSHTDREWADQLAQDLRGRGVTVFFDKQSLRAGEKWEGQLVTALKACKHLICFWSSSANGSAWVQQELAMFRLSSRNPIIVPLDGSVQTFTSVQSIDSPALQAVYAAGGAPPVGGPDWRALVDEIMSLRNSAPGIRVPVAVLTLDSQSAAFNQAEAAMIMQRLGLNAGDLKDRYGARRLDWKPFIGGQSIESYLGQSRKDINDWLAASPNTANDSIDWEYPDDARFWSDPNYARQFAGKMEGGQPGLIVIDPVATRQPDVYARLSLFDRCLRFDSVAIVALHPSPATPADISFRQWVADNTLALLNPYVFPRPVPDASLSARLGIGVDDMSEVHRILKTSIGEWRRRTAPAVQGPAAIRN